MNIDISEKVVVITGSSRGIGSKLVSAFAKENAKVVINYFNNYESAIKLYKEVKKTNADCILVKADVTNQKDVQLLYGKTIEAFGQVDILINNAGVCSDNLLFMMKTSQWQHVMNTNLNSVYYCCKIFSKAMIKAKQGKIINIASLKGQLGSEGQTNYSASKAGMIGFSKALAKELGTFNISVNVVCPGFIVTDLNRHNRKKVEKAKEMSVLSIENCLNDLVGFILYLSSDAIKGVSGQIFNIDSRLN